MKFLEFLFRLFFYTVDTDYLKFVENGRLQTRYKYVDKNSTTLHKFDTKR